VILNLCMMKRSGPCLLALGLAVAATALADVQRETLDFDGTERSFHVFAPDNPATELPLPLLLLLHGSYQGGRDLLEAWIEMAAENDLILVAPDSTAEIGWQIKLDGPDFIRAVIDRVVQEHPVDCRRVYLFGISGGGVYALTLAMLDSETFAASSVFAAAWRESSFFKLTAVAKRKIPVGLFVGTRDIHFPKRSVQETAQALEAAGHPVQLTWLERRGHAYAPVSAEVNVEAWSFMREFTLDADTSPPGSSGCFVEPNP